MALSEVILVCLSERPMSGYDLAKYFDASIGFFWHATHPQIYRELRKLREGGYVHAEEIAQSGRPNRIVYSLADPGKARLKDWSRDTTDPPAVKDDLLVRLYAIDHIDREALREQILVRMERHRAQADQYERIRQERFDGDELSDSKLGKLLGLECGIQYENGWAEWCQNALDRLDQNVDQSRAQSAPAAMPKRGSS